MSHIFHVISSTGIGGAEIMLEKFLRHHNSSKYTTVISLTTIDAVAQRLRSSGVAVIALNIQSPFSLLPGIFRYLMLYLKHRPRYVISWMYHANLITTLISLLCPGARLIWNIRTGITQYIAGNRRKRALLWFSKLLSSYPDVILFNSNRSLDEHCSYGFQRGRSAFVYNGFIRPIKSTSKDYRKSQLDISDDTFLIGSFGRNVPVKRMADVLGVCAGLRTRGCPAEVLFIGRNFESSEFVDKMNYWGAKSWVHVIQEVSSLSSYYSICDAFCLCSESEGFPNVIGEAAFAGIPIFCTDISDMKDVFLEPWQISDVGDIPGLINSAYHIYSMNSFVR
jgi:glycosyltransferase involved in cell wall biosynthesis